MCAVRVTENVYIHDRGQYNSQVQELQSFMYEKDKREQNKLFFFLKQIRVRKQTESLHGKYWPHTG